MSIVIKNLPDWAKFWSSGRSSK